MNAPHFMQAEASMRVPVAPITAASIGALCGAAVQDVLAERVRQIDVEGFTPAHDATLHPGELALAASAYLGLAVDQLYYRDDQGRRPDPAVWPWPDAMWKPGDVRANLVMGIAIGLAVIDRIDNAPRDSGDELPA